MKNPEDIVMEAMDMIQQSGNDIRSLGRNISRSPGNTQLWDALYARLGACTKSADEARKALRLL